MRILHVCLAAFYVDNYSYQENILPRVHFEQGNEVMILASTETYIDKIHLGYVKPSRYINSDGIPVSRIPYFPGIPSKLAHKLRIYKGVYKEVEGFKPDVIFFHDVQFLSINAFIQYAKKNKNVRLYADCHTDYINSARSFLSKYILHGIIYKICAQRIEPYVKKFFGTLPARCDFLQKMYGIRKEKIDFAPMGADDRFLEKFSSTDAVNLVKIELGIKEYETVFVTGGKFDKEKWQTLELMKAVNSIDASIKLIVFGSVANELKEEFESLCTPKVLYIGWASVEEAYKYFSIADCVIFPGKHSVFWEQAAGQGKPLILRKWEGIDHLAISDNVVYLDESNSISIKNAILEVLANDRLSQMKINAEKVACYFRYSQIAKKVIGE